MNDLKLNDGGVIEAPDKDGTIRRFDIYGNVEEVRTIDEENWQEWANLFKAHKATYSDWIVDNCPDAQGFWTIRLDDATLNGNTDSQPVATVFDRNIAELIVETHNETR